ncbi:MAG: peptidoglycan editing factor PgeF [Bacteroidota bacterium]
MKIKIHKPSIFPNNRIIAGITETNYNRFSVGFSIFPAKIYSNEEVEYFRKILANNLGFKRQNLVFQKQEHSDNIQVIDNSNIEEINLSDGMITNLKQVILNVTVADCAAVLIYDKQKEVIGAFHSGWRGTQKNIVAKGIQKMGEQYGCSAKDMIVWISPSAGKENYEVGQEVAELFADKYIKPIENNKFLLNIKGTIRDQLLESGVNEKNIEISEICTIENSRFHSFRRDKDISGRMSAFIGMIE